MRPEVKKFEKCWPRHMIALTNASHTIFIALMKEDNENHIIVNDGDMSIKQDLHEEEELRTTPIFCNTVEESFQKVFNSGKRGALTEVKKQYIICPKAIDTVANTYIWKLGYI